MRTDIIVIGAGLIGSAAARHAAREGASVVLIGPDEPADYARHDGVFASHYDEARITRTLDRNAVWAELARRSMDRYQLLADATGISFHEARGFLRVDPPGSQAVSDLLEVEARLGASFERLGPDELARRFPDFRFPEGYEGHLEQGLAGIINPRRLLRAQHRALAQARGVLVRHTVHSVERDGEAFRIRTPDEVYEADRLVLCQGAFTSLLPLAPERVPIRLGVETVWLARVTEAEAQRMVSGPTLPGLWYEFDWHPTIPHIYLLPPVRYPDGNWYIKLGADTDPGVPLNSLEDVQRFFARGGTATRAEALRRVIQQLMPELTLDVGRAKPCILCYTAHGRPFIHRYPDGSVLAAGGNGAAAKSSDEIGRLAARHALGLDQDPQLTADLFAVPA